MIVLFDLRAQEKHVAKVSGIGLVLIHLCERKQEIHAPSSAAFGVSSIAWPTVERDCNHHGPLEYLPIGMSSVQQQTLYMMLLLFLQLSRGIRPPNMMSATTNLVVPSPPSEALTV
jgi:hypothetical protein